MNRITKGIAALLVLLAVLLGVYALLLAGRPPAPETPAPLAESTTSQSHAAVVATKMLPAGKPITADGLRVVSFPLHPQGGFQDVSQVVGKVPRFDIGEGHPIVAAGLVQGLTLQLQEGERAVAVSVDEVVGAGNRVSPGDFVDVFFLLKQGQDIGKTQSRLLLSRLKVLAYGGASVDGGQPEAQGAGRQQQPVARTALLAVPMSDVNRLLLAGQHGRLQLALRHPADPGVADPALFPDVPTVLSGRTALSDSQRERLSQADNQAFAGVELPGLSGQARPAPIASPIRRAAAPRPAPTPQARPEPVRNTVEVVRGTRRETVEF